MNNLKILLKNNLNMLLGRLQGKRKRKSTKVAISLFIAGIIGIFAIYSLQAWYMFEGLGSLGLGKLCVFHSVITTLTVLVIIGLMRVTGRTKGNDADFLLSLPIKKRDIILSKLINKYLFDLFFAVLMLLPYIIIYEITAPLFSVPVLIFGIIAVIFLPLFSVGISLIMEFIVVRLFNKIKYGNILKSLVPTIIYIILLILMLIKTSGYGSVAFESMEAYFEDRWIANQVLTFIFNQSLVSILFFATLTIIPFVLGVLLYINIYGKNFGTYSNKKAKLELKDRQPPFNHLLKKEIKKYFTTPAYLVNTIIGPILIVVLSITCAIWGIDKINSVLQFPFLANDFSFIFALAINFCIATTCISCVSISLEGKSIWLLHSLPISENQLFLSKLAIPLIVVTPTLFISSVFAGIIFNGIIPAIIVFAFTFLVLLINDVSGLLLNLWLPKLEWENETQVVKQSLSVLLAGVLNFVIILIPVLIYLIFDLSIGTIAIITALVYVILLITFICLLFTTGKKLFKKLKQ